MGEQDEGSIWLSPEPKTCGGKMLSQHLGISFDLEWSCLIIPPSGAPASPHLAFPLGKKHSELQRCPPGCQVP